MEKEKERGKSKSDTSETADKQSEPLISTPRKPKMIKVKEGLKKLPDKKPHLDFLAAVLTIPVLVTVLFLNLSNLRAKPTASSVTPSITTVPTIDYRPVRNLTPLVVTRTVQPSVSVDPNACIKDIGPISISSPNENDIVTSNPVCIGINYQQGNYCSVVWAYQINGGPLSDYSNNSVCLYNLPRGQNTFQLSVKSLSSNSTQTLIRHFTYNSSVTPTAAPSSLPTGSPSVTPSVTP